MDGSFVKRAWPLMVYWTFVNGGVAVCILNVD